MWCRSPAPVSTSQVRPRPATVGDRRIFLMVARLMRGQGPGRIRRSRELVRARFPDARFRILGPLDTNPTGHHARRNPRLGALQATSNISAKRATSRRILRKPACSCCRAIIAKACRGRSSKRWRAANPVITTDMPGCQDAVTHRLGTVSSYRPATRRPWPMAMVRFIESPELVTRMGAAGAGNGVPAFRCQPGQCSSPRHHGTGQRQGQPDKRPRAAAPSAILPPLQVAIAGLAAPGDAAPSWRLVAPVRAGDLGQAESCSSRIGRVWRGKPSPWPRFRTMRTANDIEGRPLPRRGAPHRHQSRASPHAAGRAAGLSGTSSGGR